MLRAAIIGCGFMGSTHTEALRRLGIPVAGLCGIDPEESQNAARHLNLETAYRSFEQVLADPGVDVVHLCTPNFLHYSMAKAAQLTLSLKSRPGILAALASAGGTFVRTSGRLAPEAPLGVAAAACGLTIAGAAWWVRGSHVTAAVAVVAPLAVGALSGLVATHERLRKARAHAAPDQREVASPQKPA